VLLANSTSASVQIEAIAALANLAVNGVYRHLRALAHHSTPVTEVLCWFPDDNEAAIAELGGLKPIIKAAGTTGNKELQSQAARALRNLSVNGTLSHYHRWSCRVAPCRLSSPAMALTQNPTRRSFVLWTVSHRSRPWKSRTMIASVNRRIAHWSTWVCLTRSQATVTSHCLPRSQATVTSHPNACTRSFLYKVYGTPHDRRRRITHALVLKCAITGKMRCGVYV